MTALGTAVGRTHRGVLFDMDGVVVDTEQSVSDFWQDLAADHGRPPIDQPDLQDHVFGRHAEHTLREMFPMIAVTGYPEVLVRLRENQESLRYEGVSGVVDLVHALADNDVPIALVTGAQSWKVDAVLKQLDLSEAFGVQIRAEDVATGKPDPACYRLGAERIGVPASECVVFEDAISGIAAAVAAGATCVAVGPARRTGQLLGVGAVTVVENFDELEYDADGGILRLGSAASLPLEVSCR